jgi:hypothetical protein
LVFDVLNETTQDCINSVYQINEVKIIGNTGNLDLTFNGEQFVDVNLTCYSDASNNSCVSNAVALAASQNAQALAGRFSWTDVQTKNIAELLVTFSNEISNISTQTCANNVYQKNGIEIEDNSGTIKVTYNWSQSVFGDLYCTQQVINQSESYNQLKASLEQTAISESKGILGGLIFWIIIIIAIVAVLLFMKGGKEDKNGKKKGGPVKKVLVVTGILAIGLGIYFLLAWILAWWPFNTRSFFGFGG